MSDLPLVSFIIVARNAERYLAELLNDLLAQDYPAEKIEFLYVDSNSRDSSIEIVKNFKSQHHDRIIHILHNPKEILACGWNVALGKATGDVIIRVDAHARIPKDFIRLNVEGIQDKKDIVGGQRISILPKEKALALYALAEASKFGAGSADFKNPGPARFVDTLAHAAYRREVFLAAGGYDERLVRTEDNEMHQRMKELGFKFYFSPEIKSYHYPRANLKGLLNQKFANGYWVGLTMAVSPKCFGLRHFVPLLFFIACFGGLIFGAAVSWLPLIGLLVLYFSCAVFFARKAIIDSSSEVGGLGVSLPFVFLLIHLSYGLGTMLGLMSIPQFIVKHGSKQARPGARPA